MTLTDATAAAVVACARGWIGTRFHHQGRLKAVSGMWGGCDCIGLVIGVAGELGLSSCVGGPLTDADCRDYGREPHGQRLEAMLARHLWPVPPADPQGGDVALFAIEGQPRHVGILTGGGLIHAYAPARRVTEHALDAWWRERLVAAYRFA